jgi:hypothetical protein
MYWPVIFPEKMGHSVGGFKFLSKFASAYESNAHLNYAKVAQLVEHDLAKVGVAGSSPVFRSTHAIELASI